MQAASLGVNCRVIMMPQVYIAPDCPTCLVWSCQAQSACQPSVSHDGKAGMGGRAASQNGRQDGTAHPLPTLSQEDEYLACYHLLLKDLRSARPTMPIAVMTTVPDWRCSPELLPFEAELLPSPPLFSPSLSPALPPVPPLSPSFCFSTAQKGGCVITIFFFLGVQKWQKWAKVGQKRLDRANFGSNVDFFFCIIWQFWGYFCSFDLLVRSSTPTQDRFHP